jgi:hypothetical protein
MSEETQQEQTIIEQVEELAGMGLDISIEENAFVIRPAEAGIALLAAIREHDDEMSETWTAVDDMAETVEQLRAENNLFRQLLLDVVEIFDDKNMTREATIISRAVWSVKGINEDGEEVEFQWNDDIEPDGPFGWLLAEDEEE